jgi:hypothetical protein
MIRGIKRILNFILDYPLLGIVLLTYMGMVIAIIIKIVKL